MEKPKTKEHDENTRAIAATGALSVAAATVQAAGAANATLSAAVLAALVTAVGPTVAFLWQTTTTWNVRQTEKWWAYVSKHLGDDDFRTTIEQRLLRERVEGTPDPKTSKVIGASVRTLLEGLDDALVPALALLSAEYLRDNKPVDQFFRAMARTLADLEASGLRDLQAIADLCEHFSQPGVDFKQSDESSDLWVLHQAHEEYVDHPSAHPRETSPFSLEDGPLLVALLRRHGIGWESMTSLDRRNAFRCFLDLDTMARVRRLITPMAMDENRSSKAVL